MRQHPDPDDLHDQDLDEEPGGLGTPVYQGDGLSVRALTAEELQRFLDAHARPARPAAGQRLGRPGPTGHPLGVPRTPTRPCDRAGGAGRAGHRQPGQPRPLRPGRLPAAPRARAGRLDPQPGLAGAAGRRRRPRRPGARRPGRPAVGRAGRPGRGRAGRLAAAVPALRAGPHLAARRPRGARTPPACWTGSPATASWSSTTWPCPARQRQRRSPGDRPHRRVRHRHQAVDRQRPPEAPTGWPGTTTTAWTAPWRRSAGKPRRSAACSAPAPPRCCASTAPTSKAAAWTPRAWRSSPPTCSAARSAMTGCCRTPTWSCSPPPPEPAPARPPDPADPDPPSPAGGPNGATDPQR